MSVNEINKLWSKIIIKDFASDDGYENVHLFKKIAIDAMDAEFDKKIPLLALLAPLWTPMESESITKLNIAGGKL